MRKLGEFMLRGPGQEILVLTLAMVMSLFLSPLSYLISGTPLALLALRKGAAKCIRSAIACLVMLMIAMGIAVPATQQVIIVFALMIWLPVLAASQALRITESQAMMLLMSAVMACLIAISIHLTLGDVESWWRDLLLNWVSNNFQGEQAAGLNEAMNGVIPYMNAIMMGAVVGNIAFSVLLGRWWQSTIFFKDAFKKEFLELRLPLALSVIFAVSLLLTLIDGIALQAIAKDVGAIIIVIYSFQGIARVHRMVEEKGRGRFILTFMYIMVIFMTLQMIIFLGLMGLLDSLGNRRQSRS